MVFPEINPTHLENLSVTVSRASTSFGVSGMATMKSMVTVSNGTTGVEIGLRDPYAW